MAEKCRVCGSRSMETRNTSMGPKFLCMAAEKDQDLHDRMKELLEEAENTASPLLRRIIEIDLKRLRRKWRKVIS